MHFTTSKPLGGKIKHRYSDFIVQEVCQNKEVCRTLPEGQTEEIVIPENIANKQFLHCTLLKTNNDVQAAMKSLALKMQCGKSRIGFAGLKDKRGVTSQRISFFEPDVEKLKTYKNNMIKLFDFSWQDEKIDLGNLQGNKFTITIRNIDKDEKEIESILKDFAKEIFEGIPNYFGEQRFGGIRKVTHEVGKLFIFGKIKDAVLLYLTKISEKEADEIKEARGLILEGQYKEASKKFYGRDFRYERAILNALIKEPNDFLKAFQQLPKNLMILFPHAYQSSLFNKYLELRYKELGKDFFKAQKGDSVNDEKEVLGSLFGFESSFSEGLSGKIEKKILEDEGVTFDMFKVQNFPQMSVSGEKRPIKLNIFDFEVLEVGKDEFFEDKHFAKISFALPKNSYATVVLEELMKLQA